MSALRQEFESWAITDASPIFPSEIENPLPDGTYRTSGANAAWVTWQASRAQPINDTIASQLDSVTIGKMHTITAQGMKPVGVVMLADDGKRATIDMGRVTWTGQATLPEMPMCTESQTAAVQSTDSGSESKNAAEIDVLERLCNCGKQSMGWCICNSCHKQPDYNYDKTIRALSAATEFKHGAMHLSARKFWEVYGAPITQPLIAEAAQDDGPDLSSAPIPAGDAWGNTLDRLYAAFHREPCGDTLQAIGCAIQELQALEAIKRDDVAGDAERLSAMFSALPLAYFCEAFDVSPPSDAGPLDFSVWAKSVIDEYIAASKEQK